MKENKNRLKKSQKKKLGTIFVRVLGITLAICLVLIGAAATAYKLLIYDDGGGKSKSKDKKVGGLTTIFKEKDINETLAVFGVDEDGFRTDVIFVLNYNSKTNKAKVISVPRDTKVEWSEEQKQRLKESKNMDKSTSKINEMTSYGGIDNIRDYTIDELENMLGIKIDNYVIVTLDAFRKIVDAIGGVEVDVPTLNGKGLQYDDNSQDLHIHLEPGLQVLDGKQAEGLVRYRKGNDGSSYPEGDVGRVKTQQLFLKAFASKVLSSDTLSKLPKIVPIIFSTVKTDMELTEIPQYYSYIKKFDLDQLTFNIVPGEAAHQDRWYFILDKAAMPAFLDEIFYDKGPDNAASETVVEDKSVSIEVLNATAIKGAAGGAKDTLEKAGYDVKRIDNYNEDIPNTIIYAKDPAKGRQFQKFYSAAQIEQKSSIDYDIQIILGEDIK